MLNSTGGLKGTVRESIIWKVMYGFGLCLDLDCQWGLYSGHLLSLECRGFTLFLIFTMKGPMARYKLCAFVAEIRHLAQFCALMKQNYFHKLWSQPYKFVQIGFFGPSSFILPNYSSFAGPWNRWKSTFSLVLQKSTRGMSWSCSLQSDYLTRHLVAMYNYTYLVADHIPIDSKTNSKSHN